MRWVENEIRNTDNKNRRCKPMTCLLEALREETVGIRAEVSPIY